MDMQMVDDEDKRGSRRMQQGADKHAHNLPNRKTRRMIAKRRKIFKKPGLWQAVNKSHRDRMNGGSDES